MKEDSIQIQIVNYLRRFKDTCLVFHVPNGGYRNIIEATKFKKLGVLSGVADLIVLLPKRIVFLEVKTKRGKQSEKQRTFEQKVKDLGFEYYVVRSVEDVKKLKLV